MELSAEDVDTEQTFNTFSGALSLPPGEYRVKLRIDGEWRPALGYPTETDALGECVNVLVVT